VPCENDVLGSVMAETDAERIKRLQALCDQLEVLRKTANEICKEATSEIRRAQRSGQRERRNKAKKVKRDRRAR
jgi:hypothetical protein